MGVPSAQDGAFAWLICFASFFNLVMIGGFVYSPGMFFIIFKETFNATDSDLALLSSMNIAVMHLICPFTGAVTNKFDDKVIAKFGTILSTVGIATAAFATKMIHLHLGFGVLAGLGLGITYNISFTVINPYFKKYKRFASSLVMSGLGVGSLVFPPVIKLFQDLYGWRGAMLMLAGLNVHVLVSSCTFRPFIGSFSSKIDKLDQGNGASEKATCLDVKNMTKGLEIKTVNRWKEEIQSVNYLLRNIPYMSGWLCSFLGTFSSMIIVIHFGNYVLTNGYSKVQVVQLYTVFGFGNTIARLVSGGFAQLLKLNLALYIMVTLFGVGLLTMILPFMDQEWMLYGYSTLYQLLLAPYNILNSTIILEYVPANYVPLAFGVFLVSTVPGFFLGGPIAAWIYTHTGVYDHVFYLSGGLFVLCGLIMLPSSCYIHKKKANNTSDS